MNDSVLWHNQINRPRERKMPDLQELEWTNPEEILAGLGES